MKYGVTMDNKEIMTHNHKKKKHKRVDFDINVKQFWMIGWIKIGLVSENHHLSIGWINRFTDSLTATTSLSCLFS